jgi:creatinine amidohydrolase
MSGAAQPNVLRLEELTREEVLDLAPRATLILPTAATEQHGPHLPLVTDCVIGEALALRTAELAAREVPVVVAPVMPFGNSHHHLAYTALSLRSETYLAVLRDLVDCAVQSGFRRLFFLNSHGGNDDCIRLVARDLVLRSDVAVGACSYWSVARETPRAVGVEGLWAYPGHAGGFETSLMLSLAPQLVRQERFPNDQEHPRIIGNQNVAPGLLVVKSGEWKRIAGYTEAPVKATPEVGEKALAYIADELARAVVAFHRAVAY